MLRIGGDKDNLAIALCEFIDAVVEREDFSGTNERKGRWDEKNHHPSFAFDVRFERDLWSVVRSFPSLMRDCMTYQQIRPPQPPRS